MSSETKKKRHIVAPVLPPLEFAEAPPGWATSVAEQDEDFDYPDFETESSPEPVTAALPKFPEIGEAVHEEIALKPSTAASPRRTGALAREVLFPELSADPDPLEWIARPRSADHLPGGPTMTPMVTPGNPAFALFVVKNPADCRGVITLRGAQLSIRVSPSVGLTHQQPLIAVLQLPNLTHVQIQSWVESVAPDATVVVGGLDASNFAEVRRLLADPGPISRGMRPR